MPLIAQPWTRVRTPAPIPDPPTANHLAALEDVEFAELLRSNLVPGDPSKTTRELWDRLWAVLRADEDLTERTYNVLEEFRDLTEDALDGDELDDAGRKRAEKFLRNCESSWQRIDREVPATPLSWAGKAGNFPPHAARVIAQLVSAIARHRHVVEESPIGSSGADEELWRVLRRINLDPDDYSDRPGES
ncbi:hypothetical protein Xcel_3399 (plasmid) [Xylanimonas cellulosilytica DSM 15894]|uniref:Uncharacterized protein n=1 Tax=Xylanimonas cellulosilytica (strain DSM 15894 / JCM 12276 / CECT 5975 / KCTC 9989 / LMG 20990 / NBRC 107835 / XIL07) TaxID=446471 RepID=D1C0T2_XYLCX|nr:hypothetical protein [Xylanimonas cellulosilytica]ACZ32398.1 hypothetical protein Xcel_3399 [Xylanimonas cellulosilytica DSM 15894]